MFEITDLSDILSKLPGIGKKSASRIAYFLIMNKNIASSITKTIDAVLSDIKNCSICGNFTINNPCNICSDSSRDTGIICIVEEPKDLQAIEETGFYKGQYHILMGNINPLEGQGPEKLRIKELSNRIDNEKIKELLIATNPTIEGETTFLYISNMFKDKDIKISKLATGLPMGGSLEYSDKLTLIKALQLKQYFTK